MMAGWMGERDKPTHLPMYLQPGGVAEPRIVAGLQDAYLVGGHESIIRDVPPTQAEVDVISEALTNFIEPARELGVEIDEDDITIRAPAVMLRPIAVYQ